MPLTRATAKAIGTDFSWWGDHSHREGGKDSQEDRKKLSHGEKLILSFSLIRNKHYKTEKEKGKKNYLLKRKKLIFEK